MLLELAAFASIIVQVASNKSYLLLKIQKQKHTNVTKKIKMEIIYKSN